MTDPEIDARPDGDPNLADLAELLARRIQAGEQLEVEDYVRRYPGWAEAIRKLMPAIRDLAALGRTMAGDPRKSTWY
jgi:eukaryotic-like serine/threonine-protein kinase